MSRPVRIGNAAAEQHQLDGYGWVPDPAWLLVSAGHHLYSESWRAMRGFADEVARRWTAPDAGIWEVRGEGAHQVHSKPMAWLALDRALRIAATHRTPARQVCRWLTERDAIAADVTARGFKTAIGSYTRAYGSTDLDASVLLLPLFDLDSGRKVEAADLLDELLNLAGPLGLYGEEMHPATHHHLGNYPQALTHAGLGPGLAVVAGGVTQRWEIRLVARDGRSTRSSRSPPRHRGTQESPHTDLSAGMLRTAIAGFHGVPADLPAPALRRPANLQAGRSGTLPRHVRRLRDWT
ncbi:MAG: glycoside hydrolase family 15 protein [Acidimicrobiales bacterium]|jgi:hypothetical protein